MTHVFQHRPAFRRLRVFAFDPDLGTQLRTASINEITVEVPWEIDRDGETCLGPGPVGEYVEVVDHDPASGVFYPPVDLNHPHLLAQQGLAPSGDNPQFHQQMVYAVAMVTIGNFERALGRVALWAPRVRRDASGRRLRDADGNVIDDEFVRRLRIYPHALREANAYYSPRKKALLFGYFPVSDANDARLPQGSLVFTCLSHDIIAHETTHALLDGMHPRFAESTNVDVLAFHEAFADLVAILQRFSIPEVLRHQITETRGDLAGKNLLAQLGRQFGQAVGRGDALRDALGDVDDDGVWTARPADPGRLARTTSPHARGAILLAAVFEAFLLIYGARTRDLLRIATHGTGLRPEGDLPPELVGRLADEAAKSARHLLQMCIRAVDYMPPVDLTFGDYLRGLITADHALHPDDRYGYRVAVIESFRRRGIHPTGIRGLSEQTLRWPSGMEVLLDAGLVTEPRSKGGRKPFWARLLGWPSFDVDWDLETEREEAWLTMRKNARRVHAWLTDPRKGRRYVGALGLTLDEDAPRSVFRDHDGAPAVEIHSVRTSSRRGSRGALRTELVVEITQRRRGYHDREEQGRVDRGERALGDGESGDFRFRRGCTILINPATMEIRHVIRTRGTIADDGELERVRRFITAESPPPENAFDAGPYPLRQDEGIARLHREVDTEGDTEGDTAGEPDDGSDEP